MECTDCSRCDDENRRKGQDALELKAVAWPRKQIRTKHLTPIVGVYWAAKCAFLSWGSIVNSIIMKKKIGQKALWNKKWLALFSSGTVLQCSPSAPQNIAWQYNVTYCWSTTGNSRHCCHSTLINPNRCFKYCSITATFCSLKLAKQINSVWFCI